MGLFRQALARGPRGRHAGGGLWSQRGRLPAAHGVRPPGADGRSGRAHQNAPDALSSAAAFAPPGGVLIAFRTMSETRIPSDSRLRHYWHPVVGSDEVGERPLGVRLLDEPVVLYRVKDRVVALKDLCIHRGTPLSRGWLDDGILVCAYHGWSFAPDGACVRIPALDPSQPIPRKARVPAYRVAERYGLVWICLAEPRAPLPDFPELEDPSLRTVPLYPPGDPGGLRKARAARMIENFIDSSHFAWVHTDTFGRRDMPHVPSVDVKRVGNELAWELDIPVPS